MNKRFLTVTSLLLMTLSLSAIDLDETTTTIIEEASKATAGLQEQFDMLNEEVNVSKAVSLPQKQENPEPIAQEVITVTEINETIIETETISQELNISNTILIENNITNIKKEDNLTLVTETNKERNETTPLVTKTVDVNATPAPLISPENNMSKEILPEPIIVTSELNVTQTTQEELSTITTQDIENNESEEEHEEVEGSITKGLVIFKTKLKGPCGMKGDEFAKNYTQEDWDDIYDSKEFKKVVIELCPKMEGIYQDKWTPHLYQFSLKYASDSDEIPEC